MIFLRFPNKAAFLAAAAAYTDDEGNVSLANLDVIGTIYEGGEYDDEGNVVTPPTQLPGYHVNMLGPVPAEFRPFVIKPPRSPMRVFAGWTPDN